MQAANVRYSVQWNYMEHIAKGHQALRTCQFLYNGDRTKPIWNNLKSLPIGKSETLCFSKTNTVTFVLPAVCISVMS